MLDQELGEETRIQPGRLLKSADGRVFGGQPEVQRSVPQGEIEIDQQGALGGILGQGYRKIAGQSGDARATLGAEEHQQLTAGLLGASCGTARRSPNHGLGHGAGGERQGKKLASAGSHAAHQQVRIGFGRVDHHGRNAVGANALHQFQGVFGVAVQIDNNDVVTLFEQPRHIVQPGRVRRKLADFAPLASG